MEKLDIESIDKLLNLLSSSGFIPTIEGINVGITAEFIDDVSRTLGCSGDAAINRIHSPSNALHSTIGALVYQNLLLAKRVSEIEGLFKYVHVVAFPSDEERKIFEEKYVI